MIRKVVTFRLQGYHLLWPDLSRQVQLDDNFVTSRELHNAPLSCPATPLAQRIWPLTYQWFGLFRVRSPLLTESLNCFLFLQVLRCFSSLGWLRPAYVFSRRSPGLARRGFPIRKSTGKLASSKPWLIAGSYVLLRLSVPRHPPHALTSLVKKNLTLNF